jgi:hypothetical protein
VYFTVRRDDFANLHPNPPFQYFLVTQVFTADGEYICTQLLGIDLRAVKYFAKQGYDHRAANQLAVADRERIQACFDGYARFSVESIVDGVLGHRAGADQKIH